MKSPKSNIQNRQQSTSKLGFFGKFLIFFCLLFVGFTILPQVIVIGLGLLPTLTIVLTETKNINKITTVGCFNVAGVMICLNSFIAQYNENRPFLINENITNLIIMMAAAAVGNALRVQNTGRILFAVGAVLFLSSDLILIFNTFGKRTRMLWSAICLALYYPGQLLIALAIYFGL